MSTLPLLPHSLPPDLLERWWERFVNRPIPYAVQQEEGTYRWVYGPCTPALLSAHLQGAVTLALASTDARGACRWVCLDVDASGMLPQLLTLRSALAELNLPGLVEASRRGGHLWLFFDAPLSAVAARFVIAKALEMVNADGVEVPAHERYPDVPGPGGIGHAMRLPPGIHRKTGRRYPLFDDGLPCAFTSTARAATFVLDTPMISSVWAQQRWEQYRTDSRARANRVGTPHAGRPEKPPISAQAISQGIGTRSAVIRWVDAEVSPLDLLADLVPEVELKRQGSGYLGWCPFYDDRAADEDGRPGSPSFYVVEDRRYGWSWRCLSTNCAFSLGPMKHSFRLLQELLELGVAATIHEARRRWPECPSPAAPADPPSEQED
jgi:TOTE conflict system, Archaeo-Eukaryotic Primase domain